MDIASLIVAIGALTLAGASAWYARRSTRSAELSAEAADRSATAAEKPWRSRLAAATTSGARI
jgi:hypothetical protein